MMVRHTAHWTLTGLFIVFLLAGLPIGSATAANKAPVVVELFTSQGCSSCPPADAFLGQLTKRDDVLALAYHVDYWDYIGWKDTFASKTTTNRQRSYGQVLGQRYVYTPQMVIGGRLHEVGSNQADVEKAIKYVAMDDALVVMTATTNATTGQITVHLPETKVDDTVWIWLMRYDDRHEVEIGRGENRGNKLSYYNVVRDIQRLAVWDGSAEDIALDIPTMRDAGSDGCVVIVQSMGYGPILGAIKVPFAANP